MNNLNTEHRIRLSKRFEQLVRAYKKHAGSFVVSDRAVENRLRSKFMKLTPF